MLKASEITRRRQAKGLSMRQLAKITRMNISQISGLENGQLHNPTIRTICKLAKALDCEPWDLFDCN